jgi:polyisoprenoid-binding protein YceI
MRLMPRFPLPILFAAVVLAGCGGVQRASITAPMVVDVAGVTGMQTIQAPPRPTKRNVVRPEGSSIDVTSATILASFDSKITRFRGRLDIEEQDPTQGRLFIDFDMTSFENPSRMVTLILQQEFLEVDAHPHAQLEARFRRAGGAPDERLVEGILDLHGVQKGVSFKARVTRDGTAVRLTATFDLDRQPFGIRQHDEWDWVNKNDFRVRLDLRGTPERVEVEEVPAQLN